MFYSHQLLSKKGPLGQIWIAATMKAKVSRRNTERIDIEETCLQLLQPQVPLALRLSGILMGGIVLIFHRKVKFLQDDVAEFLHKLRTAVSPSEMDYIVNLPKGKLHARYENVTIDYNFDNFDDIERPMVQSDADLAAELNDIEPTEYIFVTKPVAVQKAFDIDVENDLQFDRETFQADREDITLPDELHGPGSSNDQFPDFGMDLQDERLPVNGHDQVPMDQFFPEVPISDENNGATFSIPTGSNTVQREGQQVPRISEDPQQNQSPLIMCSEKQKIETPPENDEENVILDGLRDRTAGQKKRRRCLRRKPVVFDDGKEIPATEFESWLKDRKDILGRAGQARDSGSGLQVEKIFHLPIMSLSNVKRSDHDPTSYWAPELTNMWSPNFPPEQAGYEGRLRGNTSRIAPSTAPHAATQTDQVPSNPSSDRLQGETAGASGTSSSTKLERAAQPSGSPAQDLQAGEIENQNASTSDLERLRSDQPDLNPEYGSIEKLRTGVRSPSTGSEDLQLGHTPGLSGQFGTSTGGKSHRNISTPMSGRLPYDLDAGPFDDGSARFKRARLSSPALGSGDLPVIHGDTPMRDDVGVDSAYVASLKENLLGSVSQFELLEETCPSLYRAEPRGGPPQAMDNTSVNVLQCLRQNFKDPGAASDTFLSLKELSQGMNRSQAARLFYQVLVLTSNSYLGVTQKGPFADIQISPVLYFP